MCPVLLDEWTVCDMATFAYIALDAHGRQTSGSVPADSRAAAMQQVISQGLHPVSVEMHASDNAARAAAAHAAAQGAPAAGRVSRKIVEAFTRELAGLLSAGVPLSRALYLLRREASNPTAKTLWSSIHDDVVGGMALADALAKWPRSFPPVYTAMVRAGEAGGFLDVVLGQIADFRVREAELMGRVKVALIYPAVLTTLASGVMVFLLVFFIPRFTKIFADFGSALPVLTQVIVAASDMVMRYGLIVLIAVALVVLSVRRLLATEAGHRAMERITLKLPGIGKLVAHFALVRFARMLGTLIGAGVPLVSALRVAKEAIGNQTLADAVEHAIEQVRRGAPLARSLGVNPQLFPASVVEVITVAEETSRLDKELVRLAATFEGELDRQLRMLVALAEPLLLLLMAGIIGTIVVAMLLPILNLQDVVH